MLESLRREGVTNGLICSSVSNAANDLFLHAHFIHQAVAVGHNILIFSKSLRTEEYEGICARYSIRLKPNQLTVVSDFESDTSTVTHAPGTVIFEDLSIWEQVYGISPDKAVRTVLQAVDNASSCTPNWTVFVSTTQTCTSMRVLRSHADRNLEVELIGSGYSKDVTGSITITSSSYCFPSPSRLHYLVTERAVTCTYPGQTAMRM